MKTLKRLPIPCSALPWLALLALPLCFHGAVWAQSLWHDDSRSLIADKRASGVGDILTIVVSEISSANKNNQTTTEKTSSWTAAVASFLYPGFLQYKGSAPAVQYNSDLKHAGTGAINNSETIVAQVTVKVMDVLPNHNLVIEGKRETSFAGEHQSIVLHGIIRPEDISSTNTISSCDIADATIQIVGKGTVTDSTSKGWFTRILDKVNPF
ncbi:MAG: flagellar basal body L-ring protein FlgH [Verrucomicrobiota bacterium]|jgi:flagellar L-ring protein precursor FlgH